MAQNPTGNTDSKMVMSTDIHFQPSWFTTVCSIHKNACKVWCSNEYEFLTKVLLIERDALSLVEKVNNCELSKLERGIINRVAKMYKSKTRHFVDSRLELDPESTNADTILIIRFLINGALFTLMSEVWLAEEREPNNVKHLVSLGAQKSSS